MPWIRESRVSPSLPSSSHHLSKDRMQIAGKLPKRKEALAWHGVNPRTCQLHGHAEARCSRAGAAQACAAGTRGDEGSMHLQRQRSRSHVQGLEGLGGEEKGPPTPGHCVFPPGTHGGWSWGDTKAGPAYGQVRVPLGVAGRCTSVTSPA